MRADEAFYEGLRRRSLGLCLCWHIVPKSMGDELFFTNHDKEITVGGMTFKPTSSFSGSAVASSEGFAVDNMSLTALTSDDLSEEDLLAGVYDDALIYVYAVQWDNTDAGLMLLKMGWLGEATSKGGQFETEIRGLAERLQRKMGNNFIIECGAIFGDARCKFDLTDYTYEIGIDGVFDTRTFRLPLDIAAPKFQYGNLQFLTGENAGRKIEVLGHTNDGDGNSWVTLYERLPFRPKVGDTVRITHGCSKTRDACVAYGNILNYRGFPDLPTEDQVMATPDAK